MIPTIISKEYRKGASLKESFKYENLGTEFIESRDGNIDINQLGFSEAIIIYTDDIEYLHKLFNLIRKHKPKSVVCLLSDTIYDPGLTYATDKYFVHYVSPFYFKSIVITIKALVYHTRDEGLVKKFVFKELEMDVMRREVKIKNQNVYLRNKEFELLHFLLSNKGKLLTRDVILDSVWDRNSDILTNTVDVHISYLRKKISKITDEQYIKTIPCAGYILE